MDKDLKQWIGARVEDDTRLGTVVNVITPTWWWVRWDDDEVDRDVHPDDVKVL
ncbi:hypothetical protein LCGC14_0386270 [marine sediment metagenome]|uniref:Uncharacterized protein n=1 Tax=marine sediment metagenome TaxID=412755 RepID=A0A0F9W9V3_9ZZZZ